VHERLLLFDIDGTLIRCNGAGMVAMQRAVRSSLGAEVDAMSIDYAGRLDPLIMADLLMSAGVDSTRQAIDSFRAAYRRELIALFESGEGRAVVLPGVLESLDALFRENSIATGLLTGNLEATGGYKLRAAGIEPGRFHVRVWGDESPHDLPSRNHLPEIGLARWSQLTGRPADASRAIVIGDTPHDVACAKAHACRSLAVATGRFSVEELQHAGADLAVADLSDVETTLRWMLHD